MSWELCYILPKRIYLSPMLERDGVALSEIHELLQASVQNRNRPYRFWDSIVHPEYGKIAWSLEVPNDDSLVCYHLYMKCRREEEFFHPFGDDTPGYWEEPGYDPTDG